MTHVSIRTKRLRLREIDLEDAEWIEREISNKNVQKWLTGPRYRYEKAHSVDWITSQAPDNGTFVVEAEEPIGVVEIDRCSSDMGLGYWLKEAAWGNGFMTEALWAAVDWHFKTRSDDLHTGHMPRNHESRRILENLGFKRKELRREFSPFFGGDVDLQKVSLTQADWRLRNA